MKAIPFVPSKHLCVVREWASAWNLQVDPTSLPVTGRIVLDKAVIFLYKTDSCIGFLENLICNKQEDKQSVSEAIDACISEIEKDAKAMGIRLIMCSSSIAAVAKRATSFGYSLTPTITMHKEIL